MILIRGRLSSVSQPKFVSSPNHEKALGMVELPAARQWSNPRSGKITSSDANESLMGSAGPSGGFALKLVHEQLAKMVMSDDEEAADIAIGLGVLVSKRASIFGRSPIIFDVHFFEVLFGLDGTQDQSLIEFRKMFFRGAAHSYLVQRQLADAVPESTLRLSQGALEAQIDRQKLFSL